MSLFGGNVKLVRKEAEIKLMKRGLGFGLLNFGFDIMNGYQESMKQGSGPLPRPRSRPGEPPAVQTGNLRRSAHVVVYVGGASMAHVGGPPPSYAGEFVGEIGVIVGTNTGYGLFLEVGTSHMAARPALVPAAIRSQQRALQLIQDGARAHYNPKP